MVSQSKPIVLWPLRVVAALSLLAPALIFSYATFQSHRSIHAHAEERIDRVLDVLQEHALKALQTVERSISEVNEVFRGVTDDAIRARESDFFLRLKRTQQALPQMESIWAFDRNGRPLVSSTIFPVPRELDNSDRSYFRAQRERDAGTFVSEILRARVGSLRFFVVSGRRQGAQAGQFDGVIGITVTPEHFTEFYRKLARGRDSFGLVRIDGTLLARYPDVRTDRATGPSELPRAIARDPESGRLTATSVIDGIERRIGYRRVNGFPVYVVTGIETGALSAEFWTSMLTQLAFGLPVALAMFLLAIYALRHAQRFQAETARRESAEAALKQAQRLEAIGQLTGGVAHDFNNLLMVVTGNVGRLRRLLTVDERMQRALEAIETAAQRGTNLTRQLLSFSRRQPYEASVLDLTERLPQIREMLQSSLRGDILVEIRAPAELWRIKVDSSELELALLNLAVNARDAMPEGGRLTIAAGNLTLAGNEPPGLVGDFVALSVEDTGSGIPPEIVGRVFEPFFTTKEVGKGTGLGLSQVYGFAQQAGGSATVASEPGRGTTVTLFLPRTHETAEAEAPRRADAEPAARGRVLLVEDNAEVAEVTRSLLADIGFDVVGAPDAAAAMLLLHSEHARIDLVLTDIVMPGGRNGLDLARWIRAKHAHLPVVLATGYSEHAQAAAEEGFAILRKPYDADALRDVLVKAMPPGNGPGLRAAAQTSVDA